MMPSMAARLMSFADVEYRQHELAEEFARTGRTSRRARRAARAASTRKAQGAPSAPLVTPPARATEPTRVPRQLPSPDGATTTLPVDERQPAGLTR